MPTLRFAPLPALFGALFCFVAPACAATLNVPTTAYPTIQAAVNAAANGDTVLVADGTYSGNGNRDIDFLGKNLTVISQNGPTKTIIDCGGSQSPNGDGANNHRGFYFHSGEKNATVSGFTVKNGFETYIPSIPDSGGGSGIFNSNANGGTLTLTNCTITANTANSDRSGGGIYSANTNGGTTTLTNCTITANRAEYCGGIGISNANGGTTTLTDCTVSANTAFYSAGIGISNTNGGTTALTDCTIAANTTQYVGGGITISNTNTSASASASTAALTNCTINGNMADTGGGLYNSNNNSYANTNSGTTTLTNCTITANTAVSDGGGIYSTNTNGGTLALTNCTITANTANTTYSGGGIYINDSNTSGTLTLINDILYGDTAQNGGFNNNSEVSNTPRLVIASFSDIQGGYRYPGIGNINADPLFVYAAGGNLHLKPGSPCLSAGTASGAPTTDKDGHTRPNPPSIGAYELMTSHTHLLWTNPDGRAVLWDSHPDGTYSDHGQYGPYTDGGGTWHAVALATRPDGVSRLLWASPDGVSRLLWASPDGRAVLWYVNPDGTHGDGGQFGPYTDAGGTWRATAVSVGPDSLPHLLWVNPDGREVLWDGHADGTYTDHGQYGPYTDAGGTWAAVTALVGPDSLAHLLWDSPDGRAVLWNGNGDGTYSDHGQFGPYVDAGGTWRAIAASAGP